MKAFIYLLLSLVLICVAYFYFFGRKNDLRSRVREIAREDDIVKKQRMLDGLDQEYPGEKSLDQKYLFKMFRMNLLGDLPLSDTVTYIGDMHANERDLWDGQSYLTASYNFQKYVGLMEKPEAERQITDYQSFRVSIRDLGFIPRWRRELGYEWYTSSLQNNITEEDQVTAEKIPPVLWGLPRKKESYALVGSNWWNIYKYQSSDPQQFEATTLINSRFEVYVLGWNYSDINHFKDMIRGLTFDGELKN